ncbi:MAG: phosphate acyltransferase PlsX [Verrucomicrobiota bacterium]
MKIAIDAMGGDFAPKNVIEGAKLALEEFSSVEQLFLVGDTEAIKKEMAVHEFSWPRTEIVHASQVVEMGDKAAQSVRAKRDSSISVAIDMVKKGNADAVVSIGHTGAAVAAATVKLRTLEGVDRPGIASPLPNEHGVCNILDAGANIDAKPVHLLHYAFMGDVYARHVLGVDNPAIGLMSVGEEDEKGNDFTRETFALLKDTSLNFIGNVEGHDLFESPVDVILCDGFIGNVILKSCEATAKAMSKWLKLEMQRSPLRVLGASMAVGAFRAIKHRTSYESVGGSPLLGVNGTVIIGHGSSSAIAIKNAIRAAAEAIEYKVNPLIEEAIRDHCQVHA